MNFPRSTPRYKFLAFNFFQTPDVFRRRLWDTVWVFLDQYRFLEFKVVSFHKSFLRDFYRHKVSFPIISGPNSRSRHLNRRRLEFWKLCSDVRISPHHKPLNEASLVQMVMWQCDILSDSGKDTNWWFIASIALLSGWSNGTLDKVQYSPPLHAALSVQITPVEKAFNWRTRALPKQCWLSEIERERQSSDVELKIFQGGKCSVSVQALHCGEHFASDLSRTTLE